MAGLALTAAAQSELPPPPGELAACAQIADDALRLACYDRAVGRPAPASAPVPAGRTPEVMSRPETSLPLPPSAQGEAAAPSFLSKFWELDDADKRGTFNFTGYRPNYLLPLHYSSRINLHPTSPQIDRSASLRNYQRLEAKFQISLRTKVFENLLPGVDGWIGYTQQSLWQLYNAGQSKPFRNTDYEPEAVLVARTPEALRHLPFGWQWRYGTIGLAHQSNGQAVPLSRSWNRVYLAAGFERGEVSLVARVHKRIEEDETTDDNPDLVSYRGHGDVMLNWAPGRATASLLWRANVRDFKRGAWQFDWTYPVQPGNSRALRYYVQVFSGFGETLIDYNFRQTSIGLGLTLFEF